MEIEAIAAATGYNLAKLWVLWWRGASHAYLWQVARRG